MTIEAIPVWSLYPDWKDGVAETLEFLTSVGESVSAIEQRRGLRLTPRQYFEYSYVLKGPERAYFDLLTMRSAGSPCYLPIWHDVEILQVDHAAGSTGLNINTTYTEFMNCNAVFIGSTYDYELVEIIGRADTLVVLATGLVFDWPRGTRVVPMKKVRLEAQPSTTRHTELVHTARVKFCSLEPNRTDAAPPLNMFGVQYVLETDPNEVDDLTYTYERMMSTLDNTTGIPVMSDVTGRMLQQFAWWCRGRQAHHQLRGLFYALDGRRVPVWVPTIYADFEAVQPLTTTFDGIDVKRCGYTELGGPGPQREYILIHLHSGTRYYRKITDSVVLGDGTTERLYLDGPHPSYIPVKQINRISFLALCRLDGDTVELLHHTATRGMTTATAVFRSAVAKPGIEIEVPPDVLPSSLCLEDFRWWMRSPALPASLAAGMRPDRLDMYGNYYETDRLDQWVNIWNTNGVLVKTYTAAQIRDMVNVWFGSEIFKWSHDIYYDLFACPIAQGRYVLVFNMQAHVGYSNDHWWILCEPAANGTLTVKGAVWTFDLITFPYTDGLHIYEVHSDDDAILVQGYSFLGSKYATLGVFPSINEFLGGDYDGGFPGYTTDPCRIPNVLLQPIGNNSEISDYLFVNTPGNQSRCFGFRLPGISQDILWIYINRSYMKYMIEATGSTVNFTPDELRLDVAPYYPNGAMLRIPLGDTSFVDIANIVIPDRPERGRPTGDYTVASANWQDSNGGPAIPFLDEFTYISDGSVGGEDCYSAQVSSQVRANGRFWVAFVMTGHDDSYYRAVSEDADGWGSPVYAKVKVFDYDPGTEIGTLLFEHVCSLFTDQDISRDEFWALSNALHLIVEIIENGNVGTVVIHGPVWKSAFCQFTIPEE